MKLNAEISWWNSLMLVYVSAWQREREGKREGLPDLDNTMLGFGQEKHTMSQRVNTRSSFSKTVTTLLRFYFAHFPFAFFWVDYWTCGTCTQNTTAPQFVQKTQIITQFILNK